MAHGFHYYRHGELTLLLERTNGRLGPSASRRAKGNAPLDPRHLELLGGHLGRLQVTLHDNPVGTGAGTRPLIPLRRQVREYNGAGDVVSTTERVRALQTVHLKSWLRSPSEDEDPDAVRRSLQDVSTAADQINTEIAKNGPLRTRNYQVVAASPHWIGVAFQNWESGSPAGQPQPPKEPERPMSFPPQKVKQFIAELRQRIGGNGARGEPVKVALFDTWPMDDPRDPLGRIRRFRERLFQQGTASRRLDMAANGHIVPADRIFDYVHTSDLDGRPIFRLGCDGRLGDAYRLSDHGLFIADIINDIAPRAKISVYRVLSDWGGTDLETITAAVEDALADAAGAPLVMNFSMGLGPELAMTATVLRQAHEINLDGLYWAEQVTATEPPVGGLAAVQNLRAANLLNAADHRFASVYATIDHALGVDGLPGVLAVASAGNDSCRDRDRIFGPRLPAAIEGIVGVGATNGAGQPASYSNDNEIFQPNHGTTAYGGDADGSRSVSGLIGLYVADALPPGMSGGNTHGRAMWAGTSFAAPIVTGVAARLWEEAPPGTTADQIRSAIIAAPITLMQE